MNQLDKLFKEFYSELQVTPTKLDSLKKSKDNLREVIKQYFAINHPKYTPKFRTQGSYRFKTLIRTKDDTCDIDDGVYFKDNPENVSSGTMQGWVKDAVMRITDACPSHKKMCITVDYKAGYNVDLPVYLYNPDNNQYPQIAIKNFGWRDDSPKNMYQTFIKFKKDIQNEGKDSEQLVRIISYLKAWCDFKT